MRTLLPDPPPAELIELLERRKRLGLDRHDEVWEGVLHMVPGPSSEHADIGAQVILLLGAPAAAAGLRVSTDFNLGDSKDDFRVPDGGLHRNRPRGIWLPTAALVIEILSPGDESWQKLPFYAAHDVDEILIVDPDTRKVHWLALANGEYQAVECSTLIDLGPAQLAQQVDWP
jgi:Uma2 family endonuclease